MLCRIVPDVNSRTYWTNVFPAAVRKTAMNLPLEEDMKRYSTGFNNYVLKNFPKPNSGADCIFSPSKEDFVYLIAEKKNWRSVTEIEWDPAMDPGSPPSSLPFR
jgi:hypothetical protein